MGHVKGADMFMKNVRIILSVLATAVLCAAAYYLVRGSAGKLNSGPSGVETRGAAVLAGTDLAGRKSGAAEAEAVGPSSPLLNPVPAAARVPEYKPAPPLPARSVPGGIDEALIHKCEGLANEIKKTMAQASYCKSASDCVISTKFNCPFGCYRIFNKDADLTLIMEKTEAYYAKTNCPRCLYDCPGSPAENQVVCDNGMCSVSK